MAAVLKKLHCTMLELSISFDEKTFKKSEFIREVKPKTAKPFHSIQYFYGSNTKNRKEHAHLNLILNGERSIARLTFHPNESGIPDVREPYIENLTTWLGGFFTVETVATTITGIYEFGRQFEPTIQLSYPVLIKGKKFSGAMITGHEIDFVDDALVDKCIISKQRNEINVILISHFLVNLTEFDYQDAAIRLSEYATELVRRKG
jgi:hypothetical protein